MTYYDRLNESFVLFSQLNLQANEQLVHLHLLHINNSLGNPDEFYCADNRLAILTNLSKDSITSAKRQLKNLGLIDFKTDKHNPRKPTLYFLPCSKGKNQAKKPAKVQAKIQATFKEKEKESITTTDTTTRTREENLPVNSDEVKQAWFKCEGEHLKGGNALGLIQDEKQYGTKAVVQAIIAASQANTESRLSYNFVHAVLMNRQKKEVRANDGGRKAPGVVSEEWENVRPAWLDG